MPKTVFPYTDGELDKLASCDPVLGEAICSIGRIERAVIPDAFAALVNSIAGQQISTKALATVWGRLQEQLGTITPDTVLAAGVDALRACGLSGRKAGYLCAAAEAAKSGAIAFDRLNEAPDEAVIQQLTRLPGVGVWTAEMLLIFSLCRKNVFSVRDFGIRRGASLLYGISEPDAAFMEQLRARYSPLCSIASLYLWEISARIK